MRAAYPPGMEERWWGKTECLSIRPIRPDDAPELDALFHRLSPDELRLRFFAFVRTPSPERLSALTRIDYTREMALIASREGSREIVGVARLVREDDPRLAEFSVIVEHPVQGRGLAAHLLRRLLVWALEHGVDEVSGQILAENAPMLRLVRALGFTLGHAPGEADVLDARLRFARPGAERSAPGGPRPLLAAGETGALS